MVDLSTYDSTIEQSWLHAYRPGIDPTCLLADMYVVSMILVHHWQLVR